ncbi:MAG: hypothetical protein HN576_11765 [Bacteriovoracaceae bacterium]|jgi:hypothetical protein|nr:hypothetical protein [Bacteriovoracaceae bacterium]
MIESLYTLKKLEYFFFLLVAIFVGFGVYYSNVDRSFYEGSYVREDGLIEWLTVLALFIGSMVCFYRSYILKPFRGSLFSACLVFFGCVFLFGTLEEISYGQRIIGFDTPPFFRQYNSQGEFNLHNLKFDGKSVNKILFGSMLGIGVVFYFLIMPFLYLKKERVKKLINKYAIPVPKLFHIFAYLLLAFAVKLIDSPKKGEILEFGGCWIFLLMNFHPLNMEIFSRRSLER